MKHNEIYLKHILDEILFLLKTTGNLNYDSFLENEIYTRAFSRSFEIIGEAVKNLPQDFRKKHSDIEWKKISGMRDKIIHQYFNVDYELLWDVIKNKLPEIKEKIQVLLIQQK
ncbi:MAG: HepT-like ribonuclease domain-containing protein [Ignavibacteriaceae bacterium]